MKSTVSRLKFPFGRLTSHSSPPIQPAIHVHYDHSHTHRPSLDSISSTASTRSWLNKKEHKVPPPPLHLDDSNLHPKSCDEPPMIETIVPGPLHVESCMSSYSVDPCLAPPSPNSPEFKMPSEKEVRRRQHEKVMRTLGERIPADIVYHVPKILNMTTFPEPPSPNSVQRETTAKRLVRRASLTLTSVTANLLLSSHARSKSGNSSVPLSPSAPPVPTPLVFPCLSPPSEVTAMPTPDTHRATTPPRPTSLYSPMVFATDLEKPPTPPPTLTVAAVPSNNDTGSPRTLATALKDAERAARIARRASLPTPTPTVLPTRPTRDGFRDHDTNAASSSTLPVSKAHCSDPLGPGIQPTSCRPPRHESILLSPLVFAKRASLVRPPMHGFRLFIDEAENDRDGDHAQHHENEDEDENEDGKGEDEDDDDDDDDYDKGDSRTLSLRQRGMYGQGLRFHSQSSSRSKLVNLDLPLSLHPRPDTPFQDYILPREVGAGYLAPPPGTWGPGSGGGKDLVQRKEKRQGWSGEWNREDMRDVIAKLRNLK
ncbi:hypothetical protein D9615_008486 [Tricholomella constricta]|uniref:Uncharacterized protein n=1 Tax=Tricholomella constricta TaxID=117010 RepID=A0A8H5M0J7_9AGAR|nr:hypothetical protein D9615_008486 [Tricholomella constricta]